MQWIALKGISSLNTLPTQVCPPPLKPLQTLRPAVQCLDDPSGGQGGREGPQKSFLIRKMQVSIAVPRLPHPFFVFARTRARSSRTSPPTVRPSFGWRHSLPPSLPPLECRYPETTSRPPATRPVGQWPCYREWPRKIFRMCFVLGNGFDHVDSSSLVQVSADSRVGS